MGPKSRFEKPLYQMKSRPLGMALEDWYEAIYNQWYDRESWCEMYERPLMEQLRNRRHFVQFNRSVIQFQTPRPTMRFSMKETSKVGPFLDSQHRRCFPQMRNSLLANFF